MGYGGGRWRRWRLRWWRIRSGGGSGYRRVGDDRTANLKADNITNRTGSNGTEVDGIVEVNTTAHFVPPSGTTAERGSRGRGVFGNGNHPSPGRTNIIEYITIASTGNSNDFGDLTAERRSAGACSSATRGLWGGGHPGPSDVIDYVTISATGNAFDFGNLTLARRSVTGTSNSTRGLFISGFTPRSYPSNFNRFCQYSIIRKCI